MAGKCSQSTCFPDETGCNIEGCPNPLDCKYYNKTESKEEVDTLILIEESYRIPWTGNSLGLTDLNFLTASESFHVPSIIVFNKIDIYKQKEFDKLAELKDMYEAIGYTVIPMSVLQHIGVEEIKDKLKNKTTLISGHSGVGKSTFINSIFPEIKIKTQDVSEWSGKGLHTTTFAEMYDLPASGRIIDTPGIREFGLVDISKKELSQYFPEMRVLINDCQFNNCMHLNEPGCAVKEAVEHGAVNMDRYISYCTILESIEGKLW